jgi:hypothetical protein
MLHSFQFVKGVPKIFSQTENAMAIQYQGIMLSNEFPDSLRHFIRGRRGIWNNRNLSYGKNNLGEMILAEIEPGQCVSNTKNGMGMNHCADILSLFIDLKMHENFLRGRAPS